MIAHSFVRKGYPFVGMAQAAVTYILSPSVDEAIPQITFDDLPDLFIKDTLSKVITLKDFYSVGGGHLKYGLNGFFYS